MIASDNILEIKEYLVSRLKHKMQNIDVVNGFLLGEYVGGIKKPILSITLKELKSKRDTTSEYVDTESVNDVVTETVGENVSLVFAFNLYAPTSFSEQKCNEIFIEICENILFDSQYSFIEVVANQVEFDQNLQVFTCKITAKIDVVVSYIKEYQAITDFIINTNAK